MAQPLTWMEATKALVVLMKAMRLVVRWRRTIVTHESVGYVAITRTLWWHALSTSQTRIERRWRMPRPGIRRSSPTAAAAPTARSLSDGVVVQLGGQGQARRWCLRWLMRVEHALDWARGDQALVFAVGP